MQDHISVKDTMQTWSIITTHTTHLKLNSKYIPDCKKVKGGEKKHQIVLTS